MWWKQVITQPALRKTALEYSRRSCHCIENKNKRKIVNGTWHAWVEHVKVSMTHAAERSSYIAQFGDWETKLQDPRENKR